MVQKNNNIIWMIDSLRPGGAEQLMVPILKNLKKHFNIRVCALQVRAGNPIEKQLLEQNIPVDLVEIPNMRAPKNIPSIIRYLRTHQPALIHTQLQFADVLGSISGKLLNIPTISTQHTIESNTEFTSAGLRQKLTWFCLRNFSKKVIAVSQETREYHLQKGKIPADKITTIHNGIDIAKFSEVEMNTREKIRQIHGIPQNAKVILSIAVLRKKKGIQYLISSLPKILEKHPETYHLVVGDGEYRQTLEELAAEQNLQEKVIFTGHKTNVPEYLAAADLFVLPTLIDAFPTVLLEAMAAKKTIIASNVGGIPEIIENGYSGILVPAKDIRQLTDQCTLLLSNTQKAEELAQNGYKIVTEKFSIENQIDQLEKTYSEIIYA